MGIFSEAHSHGETRVPRSLILISWRRRLSGGSHRVARDETCQVAGTLGLFNVALYHTWGDVVRNMGRGAYLSETCLRRRVGGRGAETSDCPSFMWIER